VREVGVVVNEKKAWMKKAWSRDCELLCEWGSLAVTKIHATAETRCFSRISRAATNAPSMMGGCTRSLHGEPVHARDDL
jgi:hypothetical protein